MEKAANKIDTIFNSEISDSTKGYLLQIKAGYINFVDHTQAQQILLAAHCLNAGILSPIEGIQYNKVINDMGQARAICGYAKTVSQNPNEFILHFNVLASKLIFSPDANEFEFALAEFGKLLGFLSTRPDKETNGAGPDNLWALGNGYYFVIECKSGAVSDTISKDYCNQLGGSVRWFVSEYGSDYSCIPIMVHNSIEIDPLATPLVDMRVMNKACIEKLKAQTNNFVVAMVQNENWLNEDGINELLKYYHLRGSEMLQEYTVEYKK